MVESLNLHLLNQIDHNVKGIIWFCEHKISTFPQPFYTLDYIMNGFLQESIREQSIKLERKSIFYGKMFGNNFFVCHLPTNQSSLEQDLRELMAQGKTHWSENDKIVIVENKTDNFFTKIQKSYPEIQFVSIIVTSETT